MSKIRLNMTEKLFTGTLNLNQNKIKNKNKKFQNVHLNSSALLKFPFETNTVTSNMLPVSWDV